MTTRAKFTCNSVTKTTHWDYTKGGFNGFNYNAEFTPVQGDNEENKKFFASTPGGNIKITTIVSDMFEPGKSYFIDFTEA